MINFKQILKLVIDKAIYCGIAFFIGCCFGNFLTVRKHPGLLAFTAFFVLLATALGKIFRKIY